MAKLPLLPATLLIGSSGLRVDHKDGELIMERLDISLTFYLFPRLHRAPAFLRNYMIRHAGVDVITEVGT